MNFTPLYAHLGFFVEMIPIVTVANMTSHVNQLDINLAYVYNIYTQTKVKQHHIFSETLFWKLQNGISG